jgi:HK97 family phage prohead protease
MKFVEPPSGGFFIAGKAEMNLKHLPIEFDAKSIKEDGSFEGYASTFGNKDLGGDIILPGAFAKCLGSKPIGKIKMLRDHDPGRLIGTWRGMREDGKGLFVDGSLVRTTRDGGEAYDLMKAGALDSMSIGYRTVDAEYDQRSDTRTLKELDLMEVSLVSFPMNPEATITTVKNGLVEFNPREMEDTLRDAGLSRGDAVKAVSVFRECLRDAGTHPTNPRDAGEVDAASIAALRKALEPLRG